MMMKRFLFIVFNIVVGAICRTREARDDEVEYLGQGWTGQHRGVSEE